MTETSGAKAAPSARPLSVLPDFLFTCDSRGGCCRSYDTVALTRIEAMTAPSRASPMHGVAPAGLEAKRQVP